MQARSWKSLVAVVALSLLVLPALAADDAEKAAGKAGALDGTWSWSNTGQNGQTFETKAKLKQDGEKLTGVVIGRNDTETPIKDGKITDKGEVAFSVTREFQGQSRTTKYQGKLDGDKIKGTSERERDGQTQKRDWEAKRVKEEKPA
jgi:hypothetical protein